MAKKKGSKGTDWGGPRRREWTARDIRELKASARTKTPARKIARSMKRTEGATRQKAFRSAFPLVLERPQKGGPAKRNEQRAESPAARRAGA
jgi:hypothetical protein